MNTRAQVKIGRSDIEVVPLCLGGNVFGWTADRDDSFAVLDGFVEGGGNFIDTADGYSHWVPTNTGGESETIIGEWLAARGHRDGVVIATKVATHPGFLGLSPENVRAAAEASLQRLQTDHIDLYYAHRDDPNVPLEETVAAFSGLVDAGKVRAIGLSNFAADRIDEWIRIATDAGYHLPVAVQPQYSLMEREFEVSGLQEAAQQHSLAVFPYYALASGFLAGKYRSADDALASAPGASPRAAGAAAYLNARGQRVLDALDETANHHGADVASIALAWLRQQPTVTAPIASARNAAQLPALLRSLDINLSPAELARLTAASEG